MMIGQVTGRLAYRATDHVLIDTAPPGGSGVGYLVYCSERTLARMPRPGGRVTLYTDLLVREDLLQLFGFLTLVEREWHRLLISVQGVGARAALAILGTLGAEGVARALALGDAAAIRAAPGIGPKIAQRVILELRTKVPAVIALERRAEAAEVSDGSETLPERAPAAAPEAPSAAEPVRQADAPAAWSDALSALVNLGYAPAEAGDAIAEAAGADAGLDTGALIRAALGRLAARS